MVHLLRTRSPGRLAVSVGSLALLAVGGWLVVRQPWASANPAVNGTCDSVDRCLEPTDDSTFVGRAIETDAGQNVVRHEWDFLGDSSFGTTINCAGTACTQTCGSHADCSVTHFSYDKPLYFNSANERKISVGMRGVDNAGGIGTPTTRMVGVAIAYVGPDRGTSALAVSGITGGGFNVTWRDVTDAPLAAYSLHIENLTDPLASQVIPVPDIKPMGQPYTVPVLAAASSNYLVWVAPYYDTPSGIIARQSFPAMVPPDPIVGIPVTTPANAAPVVTVLRMPGSIPPAASPPSYTMLHQVGSSITIDIGAADSDGIASMVVNGVASLPGATLSPGVTTSTLQWTISNLAAVPAGDYTITAVARDTFGAQTTRPVVIRVNDSPSAPANLFVNSPSAVAGLPSGNPAPVAGVIDSNLADRDLMFTFIHADPNGDAAATYQIQVDTDSSFASPLTWDSGTRNLAVASGARSANIAYGVLPAGPNLAYNTDYYWRVQVGDSNGLLSSWSTGRFKLRPLNYTPTIAPVPNQSVNVGATLSLNLVGFDQDIADGYLPLQTLTYYVSGALPPHSSLNANTGAFAFSPNGSDLAGSPYTVTFCVRDSYSPAASACAAPTQITVALNLTPPTGLNVSFTSPTVGTATWTDTTSGEDGFQLDATSPVSVPDIAEVGPNIATAGVAFNRCDSTSTVNFQLRAYVDAGVRMFSGAPIATASANRPGWAPPTGLTVTFAGVGNATLNWVHPAVAGRTGYKVYRNGSLIATLAPNVTTYADSGLTAGNTYIYYVRPYVNVPGCLPAPGDVLGSTSATTTWVQPSIGLTFTPAIGLTFVDTEVGASSPTMTIDVRNTGGVALSITGSIVGADASQFTLLNRPASCVSWPCTLAAGATWTAQLKFNPTSVGAKAATFQVADSAYSISVTGSLQGNGVPAAPTSLVASWQGINSFDYSWAYSPPNPGGFQMNLTGYSANPLADGISGAQRSFVSSLGACYTATTTSQVRLRAYSGSPRTYSSEATVNLGTRPGWEPATNVRFAWLTPTSAQLQWDDPAASPSSLFEVRVWNTAVPPVAVFNTTSTSGDDTSVELDNLVGGTNYNVTIRPFRYGASLNGCGPATLVYGSRDSAYPYRHPNINLQAHIRASSTIITSYHAGGVPRSEYIRVPLTIHNAGDPIPSPVVSWTEAGGTFSFPGAGLFSVLPTSPFTGDWNVDVTFAVVATTTPEATLAVKMTSGGFGEVLNFPITVLPLVYDPARVLQIRTTSITTIGDFGTPVDSQDNADLFCRANVGDPSRNWKAMLWYNEALHPGVLRPNSYYYTPSGQFLFGTTDDVNTAPWSISNPVNGNVGEWAWSGRYYGFGASYDCNDWSGGASSVPVGSPSNATSWSSGAAMPCSSNVAKVLCAESPVPDGDFIVKTQAPHSGDFVNDPNLGGAQWWEKANDFCQMDASTDDHYEWRALLGQGFSTTFPQTVLRSGRSYYNSLYQPLFTAGADNQWPATLSNAVVPGPASHVWGGYGAASPACNVAAVSWSRADLGHGQYALPNATNGSWMDGGNHDYCSFSNPIYCVRQQVPARHIVVMSGVAPGNGSFGSQASIPGANWWDKANYLCQTAPNTDDASTWKALLWADNALPPVAQNGYITHANTLYLNEENNRLFTASSDNYVPATLSYPVTQTSMSPATGYGNASGDCGNWTSASGTHVDGQSQFSVSQWLADPTQHSCGGNIYFYCVEQ